MLERFIKAQEGSYEQAFAEIKKGKKLTHWMWFVFPQLAGLGQSETSRFYAIVNLKEAQDYLEHPLLGKRLVAISTALMAHHETARKIFGSPDDVKLCSSMTLFAAVPNADPVFERVLHQFFGGRKDERTLSILAASK